MESHRKSKLYQAELQRKSIYQSKRIFSQPDQLNFNKKLVSLCLEAVIPFYKLNYPALNFLFATREKVLPSESAARAGVAQFAFQKENQIRELLHHK